MVQTTDRLAPTPEPWVAHPPHDIDDFWVPLLLVALLPLVLGVFWGLGVVAGVLLLAGVFSLVRRSLANDMSPEERRPEQEELHADFH